jgi:cell division FtsZ-interacting protein ZapD
MSLKTFRMNGSRLEWFPKSEISQLWQNYHFLVEKFFDKVKINKELKDLDLKKNLERKIELCEKAEELLIETSIIKSFKQLQQYHEEWKEVGPVPQDKKDEIWERFKTASDQINERRREYYNKKQGEFESNYLAKTALV